MNGRADPNYDFRRATRPDAFRSGYVKFEQTLELSLALDTHVIVATLGENLRLGPVVGPAYQADNPVAVANPIYIDIDADGFQPNGDLLGIPIPNRASTRNGP